MKNIITKLFELIKDTTNLVEMEERAQILMYELFGSIVGRVFTELDQVIVSQRCADGWKIERTDARSLQFMFGAVTFDHTLMHDKNGKAVYPFDEMDWSAKGAAI